MGVDMIWTGDDVGGQHSMIISPDTWRTFLKPLHRSAEFCGTCHKVHLPAELNGYKWLRGQNHYDSFLLSGVSGHRVDRIIAVGKSMGGRVASQMAADGQLHTAGMIFLGYPLHAPGRKDQLRDRHLYRIDLRDISYLRFILEAYDGMAVLTTRDAARGIVSVTIAPGCEALVDEVISALSRAGEIYIEPLPGEEPNIFARGRACVESS